MNLNHLFWILRIFLDLNTKKRYLKHEICELDSFQMCPTEIKVEAASILSIFRILWFQFWLQIIFFIIYMLDIVECNFLICFSISTIIAIFECYMDSLNPPSVPLSLEYHRGKTLRYVFNTRTQIECSSHFAFFWCFLRRKRKKNS